MPSPMMAMTDMSLRSDTELTVERANSSSKLAFSAASAFSPWSCGTATQMECSEDAWVIMSTLMLALDMACMKRWATPGTPIRDAPSRLTIDTLSIDVMPLMGTTRWSPVPSDDRIFNA